MKIYDDAHKLAKQIRESKEYKEYKELKENIESNPVKKAQVEEFEHLRYKIQVETMQGSGNATEAKQMLQEKYAELLKDEEIKKYFDAEIQFNVMIADVNKIIAEAIKDVKIQFFSNLISNKKYIVKNGALKYTKIFMCSCFIE